MANHTTSSIAVLANRDPFDATSIQIHDEELTIELLNYRMMSCICTEPVPILSNLYYVSATMDRMYKNRMLVWRRLVFSH